jgi:hypothetical protein
MSFVRIAASIVSVHDSLIPHDDVADRSLIFFGGVFCARTHFRAGLECLQKCVDESKGGADTEQRKEGTSTDASPDLPTRRMF